MMNKFNIGDKIIQKSSFNDWSDWRDLRAGKVVARLPDNSLIVQWDEDEILLVKSCG